MRDYQQVECATAKEAMSARIDGETMPVSGAMLAAHLRGCAGCREWERRAGELARSMRLSTAPPVRDATQDILARAPRPGPPRVPGRRAARTVLALVAVIQLVLGAGQLFGLLSGLHGGMHGMADHLGNESAAWNLAIGLGLAWAAWHPGTARAQLPAFTGFVVVLFLVSASDLLGGRVSADRLCTHAVAVLGVVLLWLVARQSGPRRAGQRLPGTGPLGTPVPDRGPAGTVPLRIEPQQPTGRDRVA